MKTKILYLIGTLNIGGTERQLVELVSLLNRERFEPIVCSFAADGPLEKSLELRNIPVYVVKFTGFRSLQIGYIRTAPKVLRSLYSLWRLMRHERPDIVHGLLFWAYILGTFVAWLGGVPVILTSRRSLGHFKGNKSHYLFLERVVNRMTDLMVANSEAVRQDALRQERLSDDRIIVIHNGLDLSRYDLPSNARLKQSLGLEGVTPVIGVIANFHDYKGHEHFLDAWADVIEKVPDAVVMLVGDGPLRKELEGKVEEMGLGESVRFLGTRYDVPELLSIMDLVVHPSLEEGFSNAILEAMAAGKPVVATNVGGNPEAVIHGETGLLVLPGDSRALADGMLWILDHPEAAVRFGQAGRKRVEEHFEISGMVRQYEALYERLIAEKCPRR